MPTHTQLVDEVQQRRLARQLLQRLLQPANALAHRWLRRLVGRCRGPAQQILQARQTRLEQRVREQHRLVIVVHYGVGARVRVLSDLRM